jgi:Flp pilus assembly protein TadD
MHSPRRKRSKTRPLSRRLAQYSLFRTFQKDPLFAVAFGLGVMIGLVALAGLPRFFRTTPVGYQGAIIHVSLLDKIQAASLARQAAAAMQSGDYAGALTTWRAATSQNLGDPRLHRGVLECLRDSPEPRREDVVIAAASSGWLLGLTRTNAADLALVMTVFERYGHARRALSLLKVAAPDVADGAPVRRAKAFASLSSGDLEAFAEQWRHEGSEWGTDPRMLLYRDAWLAAGKNTDAGEARQRLRTAMQGTNDLGVDAARLLHLVAQLTLDAEGMKAALERLDQRVERRLSSASDHATYWLLLSQTGSTNEARQLASNYVPQIPDAESAAAYVRALATLDLPTRALEFVDANLGAFGHSPELWSVGFDLYLKEERWNDLQRATTSAKVLTSRQEPLFAEVLFAEYRSAQDRERPTEAKSLARELAGLSLPIPREAPRYAERLRLDGRGREALELLQRHQEALQDQPAYWQVLFGVAMEAGDLDPMRSAVDGLLRLQPGSPSWENSRAALLLITGDEPSEALRLTFSGLQRNPGSPELRINHAFALVRNRRVPEAREMLRDIDPARLKADSALSYRLAQIEIADAERRGAEVLAASAALDQERLLKPQRERLNQMLARARSGGLSTPDHP